jgi:hypothetical protein
MITNSMSNLSMRNRTCSFKPYYLP